jgi:hypothetical protein
MSFDIDQIISLKAEKQREDKTPLLRLGADPLKILSTTKFLHCR